MLRRLKIGEGLFLSGVIAIGFSLRAQATKAERSSGTNGAVVASKASGTTQKSCSAHSPTQHELASAFYKTKVKTVDGKPTQLESYKGRVLLIVNTASQCGYTSQYKGLQELFAKYKEQGFAVLGFPSNDFGGQEPGSNKDIKEFCEVNFSVKFPLFEKNPVSGAGIQPLFSLLTQKMPESTAGSAAVAAGEVKWNFEKFLIDRNGQLIRRFPSSVAPEDSDLVQAVESVLKQKADTCS